MASYRIEFVPSAARALAKSPKDAQRRLAPHIDALADNPRPQGAKRLATTEELWRMRVGAHRIVYAVEDERLLVLVVKLGHRRDVYRGLQGASWESCCRGGGGMFDVKRAYEPAEDADGYRVLVDRLWPRGREVMGRSCSAVGA